MAQKVWKVEVPLPGPGEIDASQPHLVQLRVPAGFVRILSCRATTTVTECFGVHRDYLIAIWFIVDSGRGAPAPRGVPLYLVPTGATVPSGIDRLTFLGTLAFEDYDLILHAFVDPTDMVS